MAKLLNDTIDENYLKVMVYGRSGCIAGDQHVRYQVRARDGRSQNWKGGTMERLYHRFNGLRMPGLGSYQRPQTVDSEFYIACADEHRRVAYAQIAAVIDSGVKLCVRVTTVGGLSVVCTSDHPFATDAGYVPVGDLGVGANVLVHRNAPWSNDAAERARVHRPEIMVKAHPHAISKTVKTTSGDYIYKRLKRARAVLEAFMNGLTLDAYVARLNDGQLDGLRFVEPGMDVHHLDENPLNDVPENLVAISHADHAREHWAQPQNKSLKYIAIEDEIASIVPVGDLPTYDIRMAHAPHNFVVEGFIVHNTGKTTLGVTAPQPLILLSERQGYRAVKDAAKRLGVPVPPTIWIETLEDLRVAVSTLQSDLEHPIPTIMRRLLGEGAASAIASLAYTRPRTVVFDSMSDIFRLISEDIERTAGRKLGKDGLEAKPERYWGVLRDRGEKLIRATRDLPYHVLYLALLDDRTIGEGEEQSRVVGPECPMRALPTALVAATNMTGIASIKERAVKDEAGKVTYEYQHFVRFAGPSWMATKPLRPLGDVEPPHFGAWLERVADADGRAAPPLDLGGYEPAADEGLNQGAAVAADATPSSSRADNGTQQPPRARTARRRTTGTTNDDAAG